MRPLKLALIDDQPSARLIGTLSLPSDADRSLSAAGWDFASIWLCAPCALFCNELRLLRLPVRPNQHFRGRSLADVLRTVDGAIVSEISKGLMVLVGIGTGQHHVLPWFFNDSTF